MMRQLLLLRHAKSSWDDPRLADHARPLNARGRQSVVAVRRALDAAGVPDLILVSSARRTLQTLQALGSFEPLPRVTPLDSLYLADPGQLLSVLGAVEETFSRVLLIGHNPGLHELAMRLAGAPPPPMLGQLLTGFPTGGLAGFSVAGPWWSIGEGGTRLTSFAAPRETSDAAM